MVLGAAIVLRCLVTMIYLGLLVVDLVILRSFYFVVLIVIVVLWVVVLLVKQRQRI